MVIDQVPVKVLYFWSFDNERPILGDNPKAHAALFMKSVAVFVKSVVVFVKSAFRKTTCKEL